MGCLVGREEERTVRVFIEVETCERKKGKEARYAEGQVNLIQTHADLP